MGIAHTPGPWVIDSDGDGKANAIVTSTHLASLDDDICEVYGGNMDGADIRQANARLIAAAPDLLQKLKALVNMLSDDKDDYPDSSYFRMIQDAEKEALALIAKAEGKV